VKKRFVKIFLVVMALGIGFLAWWTDPKIKHAGTIKVWDSNKTLLYESAAGTGKKIPVKFEEFPKYLTDAVVVAEDDTFWINPGFDLAAIVRSFYVNLTRGRIVTGASTITQQLARSTVISGKSEPRKSVVRKIREVLVAIRITAGYSKKTILQMYLNEMYFGNLAFGAAAASREYFDKDVSQLSLAESAFLAGMISNPNPDQAKFRQAEILDMMFKKGYVTHEQAENAKAEPLTFSMKDSEIKAPHFVEYVLDEALERGLLKKNEGINIYTTLRYPDYLLALDIATNWVDKLKKEHNLSNAALVMIEKGNGAVRVMLGGIDYFDATNSGQVNLAISPRQPGSALKPITYAAAFAEGFTPATSIFDVKTLYKTKKGEGFLPNNYDGKYHGLVLAREALASSLNLPAVEMLSRIGIDKFLQTSTALGITTLKPNPRYDLALTLGGGEVTLLDLTNVYASFSREGSFLPPYAIETISDDEGLVLYEHQTESPKPALGKKSREISYLISDILSDPKARMLGFGEKNPLVLSTPAAVKTGTTTDWHDNWTIGYTPDYTVGVWVGNNDNRPMIQLTGITGAAPIWQQFFEEFLKDKPKSKFVRPGGIRDKEICKADGLIPNEWCVEKAGELFLAGTEPTAVSQIYKKIKIDSRNGLLAGEDCPKTFVTERVMLDYPDQVFQWAVENDLSVVPRNNSPLCGSNQISGESGTYISVTNPGLKTIFQSAPALIKNQVLDLTVNVSSNIVKVEWFIDEKPVKTASEYPFTTAWPLVTGKHTVKAVGHTNTGRKIMTEVSSFLVTEYGL